MASVENPPLNRIYVFGYSANDRDFPILSATADPRVAGYQVPKDLSACPDKRYPNHVFTGAQPISGDQRVRHVWEILPSPWVPFTRYDDDLGPVQGRRRSVKNDGQVAIRQADKQVAYDAREGSAIVYTELEETWSIKTDEDGNSLFPIRDRDFYDASRGPVQERRQLFVPTGEEEGSLENVNGVITQTSYEPYNDFLSVKIVQTYKVDGPQLIGKATDNERQLVTVTTQRKGAKDYVAPSPTATRTIEVNREDAESIVERIVDTPEVFGGENYQKTRADLTPQKFRAAQEDTTFEQTVAGTANANIVLATGEFAKSEQQINKFVKRVATTSRAIDEAVILVEKVLTPEGLVATRVLTLASGDQAFVPDALTVEANVEALGDGRTVKTETKTDRIFGASSFTVERLDPLPTKFRVKLNTKTNQFNTTIVGQQFQPTLNLDRQEISKTEQAVSAFVKRVSTISRDYVGLTSITGGKVYTSELGGGVAEITETFTGDANPPFPDVDINPQLGTISSERENLGNDQFIIKEVKLPTPLPILKGQNYDETLDVSIPYTRQFVEAGTEEPDEPSSIDPRDSLHSLVTKFDYEEARTRLLNVTYRTAAIESVSLPDKLISAQLLINYDSSGENSLGSGRSGSASVAVSAGADAALVYQIKDGYSGPVDAESYVFFLPKDQAGISSILAKLNGAQKWPKVRPESYRLYARTSSERQSKGVSASTPNNLNTSSSGSKTLSTEGFSIPPTIHSEIDVSTVPTGDPTKTAEAKLQAGLTLITSEVTATAKVTTLSSTNIPATNYTTFPTGRFLYRIETSPFRFGLVRVNAIVVTINSSMV